MPGRIIGLAYSYLFARRFDDAIAEFELALRLNPNFAFSQAFYAVTLCYAGRYDEGDVAIRRALRLSPRDPMAAIYHGLGAYIQFACGKYDEAIKLARELLRQRADFVGAHRVLTAAAGMSVTIASSPPSPCRDCARRNRTSRCNGSRASCR